MLRKNKILGLLCRGPLAGFFLFLAGAMAVSGEMPNETPSYPSLRFFPGDSQEDPAAPAQEEKAQTDEEAAASFPWEPAVLPNAAPAVGEESRREPGKEPGRQLQPAAVPESPPQEEPASVPTAPGIRIRLADETIVPATEVAFATPWGETRFCREGVYQSASDEGPGFTVKVPAGWTTVTQPHALLGGIQHRYVAPDGLTRVVVVTFPMEKNEDLAAFLGERQVHLFSSFKNIAARNVVLARRKGLGCYLQGILFCRDAACHLFLTRYNAKGYLVYGLYFDPEGADAVGQVLNSVRIF
ncbi:MAG: hypothetical protein V1918_07325 [Planctomycetota bacterium]